MIGMVESGKFRKDIDGLRALAVVVVILFHFGILPNGYLGVDVFFVISGYLITGIIFKEIGEGRFSVVRFYVRRIRRIIPLSLFIGVVSLGIGMATMLPDDLENLSQSVIATNLFANNILQLITTRNYWDVANEYKPLMHTWSLGIEEQYYFLYPFLFLFAGGKRKAWLLPLLTALTVASLALYLSPAPEPRKFYLIFYRFFELSSGGIAAILLKNRLLTHGFTPLFLAGLAAVLCIDTGFIPHEALLLTTVLLSLGLLVSSNGRSAITASVLENRPVVWIGAISFSMYMWHQVLLAFARYFMFQHLGPAQLASIFGLTVVLSILTYYFVEQPFRKKGLVGTKALLITVGSVFLAADAAAIYLYRKGGVIRDVPELDIARDQAERGLHKKYRTRVYALDRAFDGSGSLKVLVIGDSYARDWVNVLLESKFGKDLDISYIYDPFAHQEARQRADAADVIFYSRGKRENVAKLGLDEAKLFIVGTKNFGTSSGFFYNHRAGDYFGQRARVEKAYFDHNEDLQRDWGSAYLNYIAKVIDKEGMVPVFTPSGKFISQDCMHLTQAGAVYFAGIFESDLGAIFSAVEKNAAVRPETE
ncbi:MAG: acyltransferase [Fibrobacteria bacterium]